MAQQEELTQEQKDAIVARFKDADKELKSFGVNLWKNKVNVCFTHAEVIFKEALRYFLGDGAVWNDDYDKIVEWLKNNKGKGLCISGNCGTGKTLIATRVIPLLLASERPTPRIVKPISAVDFSLLKTIGKNAIMVIDDIGTERAVKDYGNERNNFADLLDRMEREGGIAIITTNLDADTFKERYGERTYDRFRSQFFQAPINGKSNRKSPKELNETQEGNGGIYQSRI